MNPAPESKSRHPLAPGIGLDAVVEWNGGLVVGIRLERGGPAAVSGVGAKTFQRWIDAWNAGHPEPFDLSLLDWARVPARTAEILKELSRVPFGSVLTYGELAAKSGIPRGAQAVGQAMARNPFPLVIPCHRVVPSVGGCGAYSAGGPEVKQRLLVHENPRGSRIWNPGHS